MLFLSFVLAIVHNLYLLYLGTDMSTEHLFTYSNIHIHIDTNRGNYETTQEIRRKFTHKRENKDTYL